MSEAKSIDPNVEAVRELLLKRSEVGVRKYWTTTAASPKLGAVAYLRHLLEELCDAAVYVEAIKNAALSLGMNVHALNEPGTAIVPCGVLGMRLNEDQYVSRDRDGVPALEDTIITLRDLDGQEWERPGHLVSRSEEVVLARLLADSRYETAAALVVAGMTKGGA